MPGRARLVVTDIAALQQFWHVSSTQLDHVPRLNHPQDNTFTFPAFIANAAGHAAALRSTSAPGAQGCADTGVSQASPRGSGLNHEVVSR